MFPACLRLAIWVVGRLDKSKRKESKYVLEKAQTQEVGLGYKYNYRHLLPRRHSAFLVPSTHCVGLHNGSSHSDGVLRLEFAGTQGTHFL